MNASMLLALAALSTAQAAEPQPTGRLTLACKGTAQAGDAAKPEPISMGIIIDFAAQTVEGFGADALFPIRIVTIRETVISFAGSADDHQIGQHIHGTIDRVTGDVEAFYTESHTGAEKRSWLTIYSLKCKPTHRMF
jgi:hypothetical protein